MYVRKSKSGWIYLYFDKDFPEKPTARDVQRANSVMISQGGLVENPSKYDTISFKGNSTITAMVSGGRGRKKKKVEYSEEARHTVKLTDYLKTGKLPVAFKKVIDFSPISMKHLKNTIRELWDKDEGSMDADKFDLFKSKIESINEVDEKDDYWEGDEE